MNITKDTLPIEQKQVKTGLLIWCLIWMVNKIMVLAAIRLLPGSSIAAFELSLKALNAIFCMALMVYAIRNWRWNLDDWGFTYDWGFWIALGISFSLVGYFWYMEGMPVVFGIQTVRQALTGIWEELISTVFFTLLLSKYFQTLPRFNALSAKALAVFVSACVFTFIHYGQWTMAEGLLNTASFLAYRAVYAFVGTSIVGILFHGVSNSNYMAFPILLAFYGVVAFLNWRTR